MAKLSLLAARYGATFTPGRGADQPVLTIVSCASRHANGWWGKKTKPWFAGSRITSTDLGTTFNGRRLRRNGDSSPRLSGPAGGGADVATIELAKLASAVER